MRVRTGIIGIVLLALSGLWLFSCSEGQPNGMESDVVDVFDAGPDNGMEAFVDVTGDRAVDTQQDSVQPDFCKGRTAMVFDPLNSKELQLWPDGRYEVKDESSPTGIRLDVNKKNALWLPWVPNLIKSGLSHFKSVSGFSVNGAVLFRFSDAISDPPKTITESLSSKKLLFVDLDQSPAQRVPFQAHTADKGRDLFIQPVYPLHFHHHYAVIMTNKYKDKNQACIAPSQALIQMLTGSARDQAMNRVGQRMLEALKVLNLQAKDVSAMTVFVTQDDVTLIRQAAKKALSKDKDWVKAGDCKTYNNYKRCEMVFESNDFRTDGFIQTPDPKAAWDIPATVWLPVKGEGPYPVIVFGHGIGGNRYHVQGVAGMVCSHGFAIIAAPAMMHGGHPTAGDIPANQQAVSFLGVDLKSVAFDPMVLRGNMNQTEMDRLEMIATMTKHPDVDGDGKPDLDAKNLIYWGISLGSLMGPGLMALDDDFKAGVLTVGGGRLMLFATSGPNVEQFKSIIVSLAGSEERFNRLVVPEQTLADAGDPNTYAPYVIRDRFSATKAIPSLLFPTADQDETVPPACAHALALALRIPQLEPICTPVSGLGTVASPVEGNIADGNATAAYFQFDRVWLDKNKDPVPARHNNTPGSAEAMLQFLHFLDTWKADGKGEIIDPYPETGTPPLPAQ